jgi:uncharacterized damage-inducible protein DinB
VKETLLLLSKYNIWANKKFIELLLKQDEALLTKELDSSFSTIQETVYHMWGAEYVWLQRMQLVEHPIWIPPVYTGSFAEACAEWLKCSQDVQAFIEKQFDDRSFQHVYQYYSLKKGSQKSMVYATLLHVFNHSTYHRGQLVAMLRQAGIKKIPCTDIDIFTKK